jgi:hypothetical protein
MMIRQPTAAETSSRLAELAQAITPGIAPAWRQWRAEVARPLLRAGRRGELWAALSAWERRISAESASSAPYRRSTMAMASPVAGVLSEHSAGDLLDWMIELDQQMDELDANIHDQTRAAAYWGQGDEGAWTNFFRGPTPNTAGEQPPPRVGESNWKAWLAANRSYWTRLWHTAELWQAMGSWDRGFKAWHTRFVQAGGKPTQASVIIGPDKPPERPIGMEDVRTFGTGALIVGGIIGLGYLLRSVQ